MWTEEGRGGPEGEAGRLASWQGCGDAGVAIVELAARNVEFWVNTIGLSSTNAGLFLRADPNNAVAVSGVST